MDDLLGTISTVVHDIQAWKDDRDELKRLREEKKETNAALIARLTGMTERLTLACARLEVAKHTLSNLAK